MVTHYMLNCELCTLIDYMSQYNDCVLEDCTACHDLESSVKELLNEVQEKNECH